MPRTIHRTIGDLPIRKNWKTRFYEVPIPNPSRGQMKWISTGCKSLADAAEVIAESGVNRLVHLANAKAVTAAAIQIITAGRKVTCTEILGLFTCESSGRWADSTLQIYRGQLQAFFRYARIGQSALVDVDRETIMRWVEHGETKMKTREARMTALRLFYRYARAKNFVLENPAETAFVNARNLSHGQLEPKEVRPITEEEFRRIVESPLTSHFWRAAVTIAWWAGLRFSDVVTLEWASVGADHLTVWTMKRSRRVSVPFSDPLLGAGALKSLLASIRRTESPYVFPEEAAQYLSGRRSRFPTAFGVLLKELGIQGKSYHGTRHACATRLAAAGKTLEQISVTLAHSDTVTTASYVHT